MDLSEAEEVKYLRDENARLKKPVADLGPDRRCCSRVIRRG